MNWRMNTRALHWDAGALARNERRMARGICGRAQVRMQCSRYALIAGEGARGPSEEPEWFAKIRRIQKVSERRI